MSDKSILFFNVYFELHHYNYHVILKQGYDDFVTCH